jgi:large subunit ribosomal protein L25
MKTVEIIGYRRANLGKSDAQKVRDEGYVPCVLYGGDQQVHFIAPMILFREAIFTNEAHFVHLNIEGDECQAIMQEVQFHPVSEILLHADFLRISGERKIKMQIPVRLVGQAPGVAKGGTLVRKRAALKVYAFPKDMPDHIDVDVSELDFHHAIKVSDMKRPNLEFLDPKAAAGAAPAAGAAAPAADAKKGGDAPKKEKK